MLNIDYFAVSEFVRDRIPDVNIAIPTILKFKLLRDKHSAHRSIDAPRAEDTASGQALQAWGLSSLSALHFKPRKRSSMPVASPSLHDPWAIWNDSYVGFQFKTMIQDEFINIYPEEEHPIISAEAYKVFETLLQ